MKVLALQKKSFISAVAIALLMCSAAVGAYWITPELKSTETAPNLEQAIPHAFGEWVEKPSPYAQVQVATGRELSINQPYDQVLTRTYINSKGQAVMLAIAWGGNQRQEVKIHRPDLCYVAQGFRIVSQVPALFSGINASNGPVLGKRMIAENDGGEEAVSYWIRIGRIYSEDAWQTRIHILRNGISGNVSDGVLVRISQHIDGSSEIDRLWAVNEDFASELIAATPPDARGLLVQ